MGLDMYAFTTSDPLPTAVDFEIDNATEIHYWRNHPNLHGWMENLYREKGGSAEQFKYVALALTAEDLARLEGDIKANCLPETTGPFFGDSDNSEAEDDLEFIAKACDAILAGMNVFYNPWW